MPSHKKSWVLVKGCEYNPNRSLSLGQILAEPFEPSQPLLPDGPLPIPPERIELSVQKYADETTNSLLNISFKAWVTADILLVKASAGSHHKISTSESWHFHTLEGQIFVPRLAEINVSLKSEEVLSQICRSKFNFRKRLYMVTGVRIAKGAKMTSGESASIGGEAMVGSIANYPSLQAGIDANAMKASSNARSSQIVSEFVYAYRLCEIHYGKEVARLLGRETMTKTIYTKKRGTR